MNLFPCFWSQPLPRRFKPIKNLATHLFPPKTVMISKPVSASVPEPIKAPVKIEIPESEMCIGENNDFSEVDQMLKEMDNPSQDAKAKQMMEIIKNINDNLDNNIRIIQNDPTGDGDVISRKDLIRLLQMFSEYNHILENYFKEIKPSLH